MYMFVVDNITVFVNVLTGSASCDGPDNAAENVILEYSVGGGPFTLMATYPYNATQVLVGRQTCVCVFFFLLCNILLSRCAKVARCT